MRAVVQRVAAAEVSVIRAEFDEQRQEQAAAIEIGLLVLVGIRTDDTTADAEALAEKIAHLRIFEDRERKLNLSVREVGGEALVVSNFTLYGDCRKGRRPSFTEAASGSDAERLYRQFGEALAAAGVPTQFGVFGATMHVSLVNDGPVTLLLDSRRQF